MIGTLAGTVEEINENHIILGVGGIGYIVYLSYRTLRSYRTHDSIKLYVETYVNRDNIVQLYGFVSREEQNCMRMLVKVSGINYKTALSILDRLTPDQVFSAIVNGDKTSLKVGGVGDKLINRIITELAPQVQKMQFSAVSPVQGDNDAIAALLSLGYEKSKILNVLHSSAIDPGMSSEDIVRQALQELSK